MVRGRKLEGLGVFDQTFVSLLLKLSQKFRVCRLKPRDGLPACGGVDEVEPYRSSGKENRKEVKGGVGGASVVDENVFLFFATVKIFLA
jgi:hypothetical protein